MRKVLVLDTSILCIWLQIPRMETCGPDHDKWNYSRVQTKLEEERKQGTTFVLPLASIIESGNHISQLGGDRLAPAQRLAQVMRESADQKTPWAAFGEQTQLWSPEELKTLADKWPPLAVRKLSLGDVTTKDVADYYVKTGWRVELLTGDQGLKVHSLAAPAVIPRRRKH